MGKPLEIAVNRVLQLMHSLPPWVSGLFSAATMAVIAVHLLVSYTHGAVVGALAITEDTGPAATLRSATEAWSDEEAMILHVDSSDDEVETEVATMPRATKPITASNSGTLRYLQRHGGQLAPFRDLGLAISYAVMTQNISTLLAQAFRGSTAMLLPCYVVALVALCMLKMLWTHIVISIPRNEWFWRRMVWDRRVLSIVLPTLVWALAHVALGLVFVALLATLMPQFAELESLARLSFLQRAGFSTLFLIILLFTVISIYLPAKVVLIRCMAALLSENETAIVPFDRTFGGRLGPDGCLNMRDAWRSFDRSACVRLASVFLKTVAFLMLNWLVYTAILFFVLLASKSRGDGL